MQYESSNCTTLVIVSGLLAVYEITQDITKQLPIPNSFWITSVSYKNVDRA